MVMVVMVAWVGEEEEAAGQIGVGLAREAGRWFPLVQT